MRHLLDIDDLSGDELRTVLDLSEAVAPRHVLDGRGVALVFEKPSARTRNSMELAVFQLGGHPVTIRPDEVGLDTRETAEDIVRTLAGYHAVVCARVFDHSLLERMAAVRVVPVVNLLSDRAHPMQAIADMLTIKQEFGGLDGIAVAYVGDANNVCRSLAIACGMLGVPIRVGCPPDHQFDDDDMDRIHAAGADIELTNRPEEAVGGAQVVYTDVWTSMGQEEEADERRQDFEGYTVDQHLMHLAAPEAVFLHCLPAHRGEEVAAEVIDGRQSRVWPQAENRMHAARGLLWWLVDEAGES